MKITRIYNIADHLESNKALIIYGPRQIGKTTLVKNFLAKTKLKYRFDIGDNISIQNLLSIPDLKTLEEYVADNQIIVIDEAQNIKNIGKSLKLIIDMIPNIKILVTGSSSFELSGQIGEPLTGRKTTLYLYPIAQLELAKDWNKYDLKQNLEERLIFGSYPEIITNNNIDKRIARLTEITDSYLFKDILTLEKIKNSQKLIDLVTLLAFQIGSEVSQTELSNKLSIDQKTIARYIDLLEKSFIIYKLRGFSRNLRNEITKKNKYYFYDTGIRNAVVSNFNKINLRNDIGLLWENFIIMERIKKRKYHNIYANNYFWRTWEGQEIDLIEERAGKLYGYEIKWHSKKIKPPAKWLETYQEAEYKIINRDNYLDFIT